MSIRDIEGFLLWNIKGRLGRLWCIRLCCIKDRLTGLRYTEC